MSYTLKDVSGNNVLKSLVKSKFESLENQRMKNKFNTISFVVPAYNEGEHIRENLSTYLKVFSSLIEDFEIVMVDDGSSDNTYQEALKIKSKHLKIYQYDNNHGKGHALKFGAKMATGDFITFIDADSDLPPSQIEELVNVLLSSGTDIVIGSKRHPKSQINYPLKRRFLSYCYHCFVKMLFRLNLTDTQTGFKLMRKEVVDNVLPLLLVKRYAFDVEFLAVASDMGYSISEAPIILNFNGFKSNVDLKAVWHIFVDTCAIFYRLRIMKYYSRT